MYKCHKSYKSSRPVKLILQIWILSTSPFLQRARHTGIQLTSRSIKQKIPTQHVVSTVPYYKRVLQNEHVHLYQNSSTLQISHRRVPRNLGKTPSKQHKITKSSFKQIRTGKYITPLLALITNRTEAFSIRHEGTNHEKFVQSSRMSYIPICVRVALAASDEQSILDILATGKIHMKDRNHGLAWTKLNNGIYAKQSTDLRVNSYI